MKSELTESLDEAAQALHGAVAVLITAGAGMGVDSGLPDFRGNGGFWKAYPPIARLGISFSGMANPSWFDTDPELAWAFYGHRLNLYRRTTPHRGFGRLLEMAVRKSGGYFVFTSNVDGQFQKAGYLDDRIEECHGSIHHLQCTAPCTDKIWDGSHVEVEVDEESFRALEPLPRCINCGRVARPNILMFGDLTWVSRRTDGQNRRLNSWLRKVREEGLKLVIVEIGAGKAVPTVRMTSEHVARDHGGTLIRINPRDHHGPPGHIPVPLSSADGIDRIYERVKEIRES